MRRSLPVALLLAAVILTPTAAAALPGARDAVTLAFEADQPPLVVAFGDIRLVATAGGTAFFSSAQGTTFEKVPRLTLLDSDGQSPPTQTQISNADVIIHSGDLYWRLPDGAGAPVDARAPYAAGITLPPGALGSPSQAASRGGIVISGPEVTGLISWTGPETEIIPLDAIVTLRGPDGKPIAGWDRRHVNADLDAESARTTDPNNDRGTLLKTSGAFTVKVAAQLLAAPLSTPSEAALKVRTGVEDRFDDAIGPLERLSSLTQGGEGGAGFTDAMRNFAPFSAALNGAILIIRQGESGQTPPREARMGALPLELGALTLLRSEDLEVAWSDTTIRIQGTAQVTYAGNGFAVTPPLVVNSIPVVAIVLWIIAIGAVVFRFIRRPPEGAPDRRWKWSGVGAQILVLLLVFYLWDRAYLGTFNTSAIALATSSATDWGSPGAALVVGLQLLPWGVASVLFALPVRIAAGIGLRYVGKGKSLKGFATAVSLAALGILGPAYALWITNVVLGAALKHLPPMGGG